MAADDEQGTETGIEPDTSTATTATEEGAAMTTKKAKKAPKAPKAKATKKTAKAKAVKPKKEPKAAAPKVIIGGLPPLSELKSPTKIEGGDRNQFVNIEFDNGYGFKLWPSGYDTAAGRIKARDLMVDWLNKMLG